MAFYIRVKSLFILHIFLKASFKLTFCVANVGNNNRFKSRATPHSELATRNALLANLTGKLIELFEGKGLLLYDFALDAARIEFFFRSQSMRSLAVLYKR